MAADPRLDPDTTVWASTDAGFGVSGDQLVRGDAE